MGAVPVSQELDGDVLPPLEIPAAEDLAHTADPSERFKLEASRQNIPRFHAALSLCPLAWPVELPDSAEIASIEQNPRKPHRKFPAQVTSHARKRGVEDDGTGAAEGKSQTLSAKR
jgi:hypothetical protein